jgi:signal transduction histidine kinase
MALKSKTLRRLGLIENWNWPLLWFALPFYVLFTVLFDAVLTGNGSWLWLITFTAASIVEILFVVVSKKLFLTQLLTKHPSGVIGGTFAGIVNLVRNLTVAALALQLGLLTQVDWLQRALGAYFMGIGLMVLFVAVMGSRIEHSATMMRLSALQMILVQQRQDSSPQVNAENARLLDQAQALLLPRIEKVEQLLSQIGTRAQTIEELRSLISNQIRPLSSELSSTAQKLTLKPAPAPVGKVPIEFMTARVNLKRVIKPGLVLAMGGTGQWVAVQMLGGLEQANLSLIGIFAGWLILVVAKAAIPAHRVISRRSAILSLVVLALLSGLPVLAFNLNSLTTPGQIAMYSMLLLTPLLTVVGFAISSSLDFARAEAEQRIKQDNESLARETALFEQRMWLAKRSWSFVVHGTVQAALTAAITRLSLAEDLEQYQIDLVLQDLNRAKTALSKTPSLDVDLPAALNALTSTWQGICNVRINVSERAGRALLRDENARMCVNEIAKEAVSNAVRHGEAKNAWIEVDRSNDELLILNISNDGRAIASDAEQGVGSQMLDGLTLRWSLHNDKGLGRVVLAADLPILVSTAGKF